MKIGTGVLVCAIILLAMTVDTVQPSRAHISICSDNGRHDTHDTVESNGYAITSSTMRAWQDFWSVLGKLATFSRKVWLLCVKHTAYRVPCVKLAKFS